MPLPIQSLPGPGLPQALAAHIQKHIQEEVEKIVSDVAEEAAKEVARRIKAKCEDVKNMVTTRLNSQYGSWGHGIEISVSLPWASTIPVATEVAP